MPDEQDDPKPTPTGPNGPVIVLWLIGITFAFAGIISASSVNFEADGIFDSVTFDERLAIWATTSGPWFICAAVLIAAAQIVHAIERSSGP